MSDGKQHPSDEDSGGGVWDDDVATGRSKSTGSIPTEARDGSAREWWALFKSTPALGLITAAAAARDENAKKKKDAKKNDRNVLETATGKTSSGRFVASNARAGVFDDTTPARPNATSQVPEKEYAKKQLEEDRRAFMEYDEEDRKIKEEAKMQLGLAAATTVLAQEDYREPGVDYSVTTASTQQDERRTTTMTGDDMSSGGRVLVAAGMVATMPEDVPEDSEVKSFATSFFQEKTQGEGDIEEAPRPAGAEPEAPEGAGGVGVDDSLAVAVEVGDEQAPPRGIAQLFDPNAKYRLFRQRRSRLLIVMGSLALLAIAVGVTLGVVLSKDDGPSTPQDPEWKLPYLNEFEKVSMEVYTRGSTYRLAADWIMEEDPRNLTSDATNLIQRYVLALMYYSTTNNRQSAWTSCNPPEADENSTCTFQYFVNMNNDGTYVYSQIEGETRWLSADHECQWVGIDCGDDDDLFIDGIELWAQNMTGTVPPGLYHFPSLEAVSLPFNHLTGPFPSEDLGNIKTLTLLELHYNQLTGTILDSFWRESKHLKTLTLAGNKLSGTLSSEIGRASSLIGLHLYGNEFTGSIPVELTQLTKMTDMWMHRCKFNGTIPTEIGRMTDIKYLRLYENNFTGSIPSEVGLLLNCTDLWLGGSLNRPMGLNGMIPEELYNLTALGALVLFSNELSGTLSTRIGNLARLVQLGVNDNHLTGTIPVELANITTLRAAWLHLNQFTGSVPNELCDNILPNGGLEWLIADCGPEENPAQECECCSSCCNRETEECKLQP